MINSLFANHLVNSDPACVIFKSFDGRSIEVNKYFLFLYDAFYKSILEDNMEESLVFIFEGATFDELILYRDQIHQKHLQCVDHSHSQISEGGQTIKEYTENKTDTEPSEYTEFKTDNGLCVPSSDSTNDKKLSITHTVTTGCSISLRIWVGST